PKERAKPVVLFQIRLHQPDQPRHLLRKWPALKFVRQRDGGPPLMPARHSKSGDARWNSVLTLDVNVLVEPLVLDLQPLQFGGVTFRQLQVLRGRKRRLQVAGIDLMRLY